MNNEMTSCKLKQDVEYFVKNKLKDVKIVDEIFVVQSFDISNSNVTCSYNDLLAKKKILQLTINAYNNYEIYRSLSFKFMAEEAHHLVTLKSYCNYNTNDNLWCCIRRPQDMEVVDAVLNYIIYFASVHSTEDMLDFGVEEIPKLTNCPICMMALSPGDSGCGACLTTNKDLRIFNMKMEHQRQKDNELEKRYLGADHSKESIDAENVTDKDSDLLVSKSEKANTEAQMWTESKVGNEVLKHGNQQLKKDNERRGIEMDNTHGRCVNSNEGVIKKTVEGDKSLVVEMEAKKKESEWTCSSCGSFNSFKVEECGRCRSLFRDKGVWSCKCCTFRNKGIDSRCDVCFTANENLLVKYCQQCNKRGIGSDKNLCEECVDKLSTHCDNGWWKCKFQECGAWSENKDIYCKVCGIWRDSFKSYKRGDTVKRLKHGIESKLWICSKCHRFNTMESKRCGKLTCSSSRYGKKVCANCKKLSKGTVNVCKKCAVAL